MKNYLIHIVLRIQIEMLSIDKENKLDVNIKYALNSKVISAKLSLNLEQTNKV